MVSYTEALIEGAQGALCGFFSAGANILEYFEGASIGIGSVGIPVGSLAAQGFAGIANAACPTDIPPGGFPNLAAPLPGPGPGGQGACTTNYTYTVKVANQSQVGGAPGSGAPTSGTVNGPIGDFVNRNGGMAFEHGNGQFRQVYGAGTIEVSMPFFDILERTDGGPENCSDLPSGPIGGFNNGPPVNGPDIPDTITYDDGGGGTVSDPVTFTPLPPVLGPNGGIEFCVQAQFLGYAVQVCIDPFTGTPSIRLPDIGNNDCCSIPEIPGSPFPGDNPPTPPENQELIIVAAEVEVTTTPSSINETVVAGQGGGPELYLPDLGVITFGQDIGGTIYWSPPVRIQTLNARVESPFPAGADLVRGIPRESVAWNLTPIFGQVPAAA